MMAILVGVGLLAAFVLLVALVGWEPRGARVAGAQDHSPENRWTVPGDYADRQQIAELAARELE